LFGFSFTTILKTATTTSYLSQWSATQAFCAGVFLIHIFIYLFIYLFIGQSIDRIVYFFILFIY